MLNLGYAESMAEWAEGGFCVEEPVCVVGWFWWECFGGSFVYDVVHCCWIWFMGIGEFLYLGVNCGLVGFFAVRVRVEFAPIRWSFTSIGAFVSCIERTSGSQKSDFEEGRSMVRDDVAIGFKAACVCEAVTDLFVDKEHVKCG